MMDCSKGHLLPTFGLAQGLVGQGHRVGYVVVSDMEETVRQHGFETVSVFANLYPKGTIARQEMQGREGLLSQLVRRLGLRGANRLELTEHLEPLLSGHLDHLVEAWRPDLVITSVFTPVEALILQYRYSLPLAVFTPYLRPAWLTPGQRALKKKAKMARIGSKLLEWANTQGWNIQDMEQLVAPLDELPEFICCPPELDASPTDRGCSVRYLEPSMRRDGGNDPVGADLLAGLPAGKSLVYVSLGSELATHRKAGGRFYTDLFFVMSLGARDEPRLLGKVPANVRIARWVPQMEILSRAAVAITHGGLGTIKECIWHGVPMVVLPLVLDQPANAVRVASHHLGRVLDPRKLSAMELAQAVRDALEDATVARATEEMKNLFRQREEQQIGVRLVEEIMFLHDQETRSRGEVLSTRA